MFNSWYPTAKTMGLMRKQCFHTEPSRLSMQDRNPPDKQINRLMFLIETAIQPLQIEHILEKGNGSVNEDALVMEKNIFGVFDGATSLDKSIFEKKKTGGMIASSTACSVFSKNNYPLVDLARGANRAIFDKMIFHGVDFSARERMWSTSAAVVRIKKREIEWIQTGDSFIIIIYDDNSFKVFTEKDHHLSHQPRNHFSNNDFPKQ